MRVELDARHRAYRESIRDACITFDALLTEAGDKPIGTLTILDAENFETAKKLWENDPFVQGGLFDSIEFYRWRFGRIFDQFGA